MTPATLTEDAVLPPLREDLQICRGAPQLDGSAAWLIYDTLRDRYFQIAQTHLRILEHWKLQNPSAIMAQLADIDVSLDDIESLLKFLLVNALTQDPPSNDFQNFVQQADAQNTSMLSSVLHKYLFIRIPLLAHHAFLARTVRFVEFAYTKMWALFVIMVGLAGGYLALRQWEQFTHTFLHFFNLDGLIGYICALAFVKICHEFGHAYTATRYGCRVPTMGVAFMVMFPILYTDTTDSWKILERRKRLEIAAAGVAVELSIAAFATLAWALLPDGLWRSAAFFIATTSWVMSLAVNLNPLMRFDGYHFASDLFGIQNLQERSFAIGRWSLREFLFDLRDPLPEALSSRMRYGMTAFAWATWVYRFFLFLGIALLVHDFFFKALGILLFVVEIGWFIMIPIRNEVREWRKRTQTILARPRIRVVATVATLAIAIFIVPWQNTVRVPAIIETTNQETVHGRAPGQIVEVLVKNGAAVRRGDLLVSLSSRALETEIAQQQKRVALTQTRINRIAADGDMLDIKLTLEQEFDRTTKTLSALETELRSLSIRAPFDGVVTDLDPTLHPGRWINQSVPIATLVTPQSAHIRGYISDRAVQRIDIGASAIFIPYNHQRSKISGTINHISATNAEMITIPALTSRHGGSIPVSDVTEGLVPLGGWYSTTMQIDTGLEGAPQMIAGEIHTKGKPESFALSIWRRIVHILIRETTF